MCLGREEKKEQAHQTQPKSQIECIFTLKLNL